MLRQSFLLMRGVVLLTALCLAAPVVAKAELKAAGCKTEHFMVKELAAAYKARTGNDVNLARTGNKQAVNDLLYKKIDFAFTCKPIEQLAKKFKLDAEAIKSWQSVSIGKDPILVASNYVNGVDNLTIDQLTRIFKGEVKNWKELGGNDLPVKIAYLGSEVDSGVVLLFKELTVGKDGMLYPPVKQINEPIQLGQFVVKTPGGITFVSHNSYRSDERNVIRVNGIEPTQTNIKNGTYPLVATYYLTAPTKANAVVDDFIAFCQSPGGQEIIAKNFTPCCLVNK